MQYGFTALARELNQLLELSPPIKAQQIDMWHKRHAVNARGHPFPAPATEHQKETRGGCRPRFEWELTPVVDWVTGGIHTGRYGWKYPQRRPE